jgi:hypothetical protein
MDATWQVEPILYREVIMTYYMRLLNVFIRAAFQQEAAFRTNFVVNLLNTALNAIIGVAGVMVLYSQVDAIQGWTFPQTHWRWWGCISSSGRCGICVLIQVWML